MLFHFKFWLVFDWLVLHHLFLFCWFKILVYFHTQELGKEQLNFESIGTIFTGLELKEKAWYKNKMPKQPKGIPHSGLESWPIIKNKSRKLYHNKHICVFTGYHRGQRSTSVCWCAEWLYSRNESLYNHAVWWTDAPGSGGSAVCLTRDCSPIPMLMKSSHHKAWHTHLDERKLVIYIFFLMETISVWRA